MVWWTLLDFAVGFWDTFTVLFEAWAAWSSLMSLSLLLHLTGASVTGNGLFEWAANMIATVLASSLSATTIENVLVAETSGLAVLKFSANSWDMLNGWDLSGDIENTLVLVASIITSPFMTNWVFDAVVLAHGLDASIVTDTRGVTLALIFGILSRSTAQVVATWSADWSLLNAIIAEVTSNDLTVASTLGGFALDIVVEDHLASFHSDTGVVASSGFIALL